MFIRMRYFLIKSLRCTLILALVLIFYSASFAYAQITPSGGSRNILSPFSRNQLVPPFALIADPPSPSPSQKVTITTQTTSFDPQTTNYFWTIDGEPRPDISGLGKNSYSFTAEEVGSSKHMSVRAEPMDEKSVTASLTVYTTDLAMTWTARTYVPKWYKGKALPVPKAMVRVAAIPTIIVEGTTIPAHKLIYSWHNNGERVVYGVGKQIFEFQEPEQSWDAPTITLIVEDVNRRIQKEARVMITSRIPRAVIYQSFPLGGIEFRRGAFAFPAVQSGVVDVQVEPFFFNKESKYDLLYEWSVQGDIASSTPRNPFFLTLDIPPQSPSNVPIYVTIQDRVPETDLYSPFASSFLTIPIGK